MKKLLFSLLTLAAALTVTSCLKEVAPTGNSTSNEPAVNATFTVNIDSKSTKAFATASQISKLHIAFYKDGVLDASLSKTGTAAIGVNPGESLTKVLENLKLSRGAEYEIICWAESDASPYTLNFTNKTVTYADPTSLQANQDTYDAFYGATTLTSTDTQSDVNATIQLKRPFAQVNVLVPNDNTSAYTSFTSTMTVTVPTTMNLSTGELTGEASAVTFGATDSPISESLKDGHKYLAMNYVFAPTTAKSYPVSFTVTPNVAGDAKTVDLAAVSLKRNRRTNLVGNIFQTEVNGTITVTIVPGADPDSEEPIQSPDVTVSIGAGSAAPAGNTVNLPLSGSTPQTITIESNSTGAVTFEEAADPEVATVTETGSGTATVTPVANGSTTFVAHIAPGVTKADPLRAVDITFNVTVTGLDTAAPVSKSDRNLAFDPTSLTVTIDATYTLPALSGAKTDDVVYSLENVTPAGCVTIDPSDGTLTLKAAGTATVKVAAPETETYNAGTASYALTIEEPAQVGKSDRNLAFNPTSLTVTIDATYTLPALSGAKTDDVVYSLEDVTPAGCVTIDSSDGTLTLKAAGTATVKVTAPETETYNSDVATYSLTIKQPRYVKISSTSELTDGNYLIVYEKNSVAFNGGLETLDAVSNTITVTISEGVIAQSATVDAAVFTYNSTDKTLKSASGLYIGKTSTGNGMNTNATEKYTNIITFDSGNAVITSSAGLVLKYNDASNQTRFRYYGSGQQSIQLYKYSE